MRCRVDGLGVGAAQQQSTLDETGLSEASPAHRLSLLGAAVLLPMSLRYDRRGGGRLVPLLQGPGAQTFQRTWRQGLRPSPHVLKR